MGNREFESCCPHKPAGPPDGVDLHYDGFMASMIVFQSSQEFVGASVGSLLIFKIDSIFL